MSRRWQGVTGLTVLVVGCGAFGQETEDAGLADSGTPSDAGTTESGSVDAGGRDGSDCPTGDCGHVLVDGLVEPHAIAVDANYVYWTQFAAANAGGKVMRAPRGSGTPPQALAEGQHFPRSLWLTSVNVLWTNEGAVMYAPQPDGDPQVLSSGNLPTTVAAADGLVFVTHRQPADAQDENGQGRLSWYPEPGGNSPVVEGFSDKAGVSPWGLTARTTADGPTTVYWTALGSTAQADGEIYRSWMSIEGNFAQPTRLKHLQAQPSAITVAADYIYWVSSAPDTADGGSVRRQTSQGFSDTLIADKQNRPSGIAGDETYVYWVNRGSEGQSDGTVVRAPHADVSQQVVLAAGQPEPFAVAVDGEAVYWTCKGPNGQGSIRRRSK
jgi:hypothetical protein